MGNCTEPCSSLAIAGTALGTISLIFCIIQAIIMAILFKKLSKALHLHKFMLEKKSPKVEREESNQTVRNQDAEAGAMSATNTETRKITHDCEDLVHPALCMLPLPAHYQVEYPSTASDSCESVNSSDSFTEEPELTSPTVAELKRSLALPLKKVYGKCSTLDSRSKSGGEDSFKSKTMENIRPRALTSNALTSPGRTAKCSGTPTDHSGTDSVVGTPGSTDSSCRNPSAYVVTEIVDVNGSKRRPSVRLRESRPKKQLSTTIQKQLDKPDPLYFTLEKQSPGGEMHGSGSEKEAGTPSPSKMNKNWRQVLPIVTSKQKLPTSKKVRDENENENNCLTSPETTSPPGSGFAERTEKTHKHAMKPPARKNRPPLVKASSGGLHRGGTWSPRTLERHRMMLGGPDDGNSRGVNRMRAGSLRERTPQPYEPVQVESSASVSSVTCAERKGDYSKLIRQPDGRRRASSIGSTDIMLVQSDRAYNRLVL